MRKDIQINTQTGDIKLIDNNNSELYKFEWVSEEDKYVLGRVILPVYFDANSIYTTGISVSIPYTPILKPIYISFLYDLGGHYKPIINPRNNSDKFISGINASELFKIDKNKYTLLVSPEYDLQIYSGKRIDCNKVISNIQNRNLLLLCVPTNNYRYPTSGIGLIQYLHASNSLDGLADRLEKEFSDDGVDVISAAMDTDTGELELNLDFTKVDENV